MLAMGIWSALSLYQPFTNGVSMAEQTAFRTSLTAWLPNSNGQVTLHECVRLVDRECAIYPIFQCTRTLAERIYGCLSPDITATELAQLFPAVELETLDDDQLPESSMDHSDEWAA